MAMNRTIGPALLLTALVLLIPAAGWSVDQGEDKWQQAEKEVAEAARAVGEATDQSWQEVKQSSARTWEKVRAESKKWAATAEKAWDQGSEKAVRTWHRVEHETDQALKEGAETSRQLWEKGREKSRRLLEQGKAAIHETTAPEPGPKQDNRTR